MKQPTYEELAQAYTVAVRENEQLRTALNSVQTDKALERIKLLVDVIERLHVIQGESKGYSKIISNAKWHLERALAIPQETK